MADALNYQQLLGIFSDPEALVILNRLKPGFSVQGLAERERLVRDLNLGHNASSRERLIEAGLLTRKAESWEIPQDRRRLVYQIVTAQRDESSVVEKVSSFAKLHGVPLTCQPWLDVACGAGSFLRTVRKTFDVDTLGTDLDVSALAVARAADALGSCRGQYMECPAEHIEAPSGNFIVVSSIVAFQHFLIREALRELSRCVADGGLLFLRLHGTGYYLELASRYVRKGVIPVYALRCLLQGGLLQLGLDQDRCLQDGWLKLESPLNPGWTIRQLRNLGFKEFRVEVLGTYLGFPNFFDICARKKLRSSPAECTVTLLSAGK